MAARAKEFEFTMPLIRNVSRQGLKTLLKATKSASKPTSALKNLMAGKPIKKK